MQRFTVRSNRPFRLPKMVAVRSDKSVWGSSQPGPWESEFEAFGTSGKTN
jgi:hypothetical protein